MAIAKLDDNGKNVECGSCGCKTDRRTAEMLSNLVTALGIRVLSERIIDLVGIAIDAAGLCTTSNGLGENVPINGKMVTGAVLTVDPYKVFTLETIEKNGIKEAEEIIEVQKIIISRKLSADVTFATAATIVAYLYDVGEAKMAPTSVQIVKNRFFMLGPVPGQEKMQAVYIRKGIDEVVLVMGEAQMDCVPVTQSIEIIEFSHVKKLPLLVIYYSGDQGHSKLFKYV